jgi:hypothetical protein
MLIRAVTPQGDFAEHIATFQKCGPGIVTKEIRKIEVQKLTPKAHMHKLMAPLIASFPAKGASLEAKSRCIRCALQYSCCPGD